MISKGVSFPSAAYQLTVRMSGLSLNRFPKLYMRGRSFSRGGEEKSSIKSLLKISHCGK